MTTRPIALYVLIASVLLAFTDSACAQTSAAPTRQAIINELVTANRILANEGVLDGYGHAFGGRTNAQTDRVGRHDVYDPATDTWTTAAPLLTPRSAGVGFVQNGRIVYAGGECKDTTTGTTYNEAEVYNPATNKWTALPALPAGRHAGAATVVGDTAYVIGGNNNCGANHPAKEILAFKLPTS